MELLVITWIQWCYMDTPPVSAAAKVMLGGALVLAAGILIGRSQGMIAPVEATKSGASIRCLVAAAVVMVAATHASARTLHDAITDAWARQPERAGFDARAATADARYRSGSALVPNAPTAAGTYVNDRIAGSNYNYITTQVQVSTPLWLPGEGTATQRTAEAQGISAAADKDAAHLALATNVIELAANANTALNDRDVAARRLATDRALAADIAHRVAVGESAQSDQLEAEAEAASAEISLSQAQTQVEAARIQLLAVTGSREVPSLAGAVLPVKAQAEAIATHPRLAAAEQAVAAARANARLVDIQDRDDPEIGVQGINEKQPGTRWDTRFGVNLTFHFATEARNAPRRAEAEQAVTEAIVRATLIRRDIEVAFATAMAMRDGAQRASEAADRAAAALGRRRGQIERAWRVGEMPFIELVRANAQALDSDLARSRARTGLQAAQLRAQVASGSIP